MKTPSRKFWFLLLKISGALYVLYLLIGFFVVPQVIDSVLENRVAEQLNRSITLEEAAFNPFTLSVELIGLKVEDDDGQAFVEIGRLFSNPQLFPILTRRVSLKEFALSDTVIRLKLEKDGTLNIDELLAFPESKEEAEPTDPFHFSVGQIDIANVRLEIADYTRTLPLEETIGPISFVAQGLRSDLNSDSPYDFVAKLGDQTTIKWKGDVSVNPVASRGAFSIENLDISKAKPFWHDQLRADIAGLLSVSGSYGVTLDAEGEAAYLKGGLVVLSGFSLDDPEEETQVDFRELRIDGIEANWPENRVLVESVTLSEPTAMLVRHEAGDVLTPLRETDAPSVARPAADETSAAEQVLEALVKKVTVDSGSVIIVDQAISNHTKISLSDIELDASNLAPFDDSSTAQFDLGLIVNGSGVFKVGAAANLPSQSAKGTFSLDGLNLATFQNYVAHYSNAKIEKGSLTLNVEYDVDALDSSFDINADVKLDSLVVKELTGGGPVFEASSISIDNASYAKERLTIDRVAVDHPAATISLDNEGLSLSRLTKNESGEAEETSVEVSEDRGGPAEVSIPIAIKEVAIIDGITEFVDNTLSPSHRSTMTGLNVDVKNVSTEQGEKAAVSVVGGFDRGGSFTFSGDLEPLDFKRYSSLKLDLSSFDLSATAPYWRKYLGRGLDKGMLNVESSFDISENILDGSNGIMIDQLTLGEKVESEDSLGLPIGLAVAILKDRQGKMELPPLTLSGDLDDPSISISGIVMKALGNIIAKIATSPFSMLGGLVGGSGDEDLSTVLFGEGAFELNAKLQSQLDKMAKILEQRPGLKVDLSSTLEETSETKVFQRILIVNKSLDEEKGEFGSSDPIDLLRIYNPDSYEEKAKAVYRDLMGIVVPALDETTETEAETPPEARPPEVARPEQPAKKGLLGRAGAFLKNITGVKSEEAANGEVKNQPAEEIVIDQPIVESPEVVVELPPFSEIEAHLFAESEFQVDASWLEKLAQERAKNVKDYLVTAKGIDASRVFISGKVASDETEGDPKPVSAVKFDLTD